MVQFQKDQTLSARHLVLDGAGWAQIVPSFVSDPDGFHFCICILALPKLAAIHVLSIRTNFDETMGICNHVSTPSLSGPEQVPVSSG